jgi:hypothetical protein
LFEFHGWATIRVPDPDIEPDRRHELEAAAIARLREAITRADDQFSLFDVRQTGNELIVLYAHGLRNHRYLPVIELFRWVAAELSDSYGLLHVHDDEAEGKEYEFRVWRVAGGRFEELADPFLSPRVPTIDSASPFAIDVLFAWLSLLDKLRENHADEVFDELAEFLSPEQAAFLSRLAQRPQGAGPVRPSRMTFIAAILMTFLSNSCLSAIRTLEDDKASRARGKIKGIIHVGRSVRQSMPLLAEARSRRSFAVAARSERRRTCLHSLVGYAALALSRPTGSHLRYSRPRRAPGRQSAAVGVRCRIQHRTRFHYVWTLAELSGHALD